MCNDQAARIEEEMTDAGKATSSVYEAHFDIDLALANVSGTGGMFMRNALQAVLDDPRLDYATELRLTVSIVGN